MIDQKPDTAETETDERFPSGPWTGFFLQPALPGRHWMELQLTFRGGQVRGEGRDWVGQFLVTGRYETETGKCWWSKKYLSRHDVAYMGFNEGKGIWGTWELNEPAWKGGFHIWPEGMGLENLRDSEEETAPTGIAWQEDVSLEPDLMGVGVGSDSESESEGATEWDAGRP